ncbi:MAG: hypothetical protein OEZ39_00325 [Gammaproteobacteria bacterium]|nr:hypothetical protein [Gammaproteobacteria bacterium]MDH5650293.1 hypothetical protein [Gammaproteobacteria bacterium]
MHLSDDEKQLVYKRIRNRIIDVLEVTASLDKQAEFGANEVVNLWEDWVDDEQLIHYMEPVFSREEQIAMADYHGQWKSVVDAFPQQMPKLEMLHKDQHWLDLTAAAHRLLQVFAKRGRLIEDDPHDSIRRE